jgi:hypothetical protein
VNYRQPAVIYPLSLIELEEDYAFESTPVEVDRLIAQRSQQLEDLIERLEPRAIRSCIHPIIRVSNNVARETAQIAFLEQINLIIVGWHRPAFSKNRLDSQVTSHLTSVLAEVKSEAMS